MKTEKKYQIEILKEATATIIGVLTIKTTSAENAMKILKGMTLEEIDDETKWKKANVQNGQDDISTIQCDCEFTEV